jgi:putative SOS response-associated peptidase YedK
MCGRFTLRTPPAVLIEHFDLDLRGDQQLTLFDPRYNIAPTQDVVVIRADEASGRRSVSSMRWGLVPSWAKKVSGPPQINARAETLADKPTFRSAYRRRRCLIPADGFYEWQQSGSGKGTKQPFYIHRPGHQPFAFAGLWESWTPSHATGNSNESKFALESCAIVTTEANKTLSHLHERMPVILSPQDHEFWLDPSNQEPERLNYLLTPSDAELVAEPVSTYVNRVMNDDPRCIAVQRSLFD